MSATSSYEGFWKIINQTPPFNQLIDKGRYEAAREAFWTYLQRERAAGRITTGELIVMANELLQQPLLLIKTVASGFKIGQDDPFVQKIR